MVKNNIRYLLVLLLSVGALTGCSREQAETTPPSAEVDTAAKEQPIANDTAAAQELYGKYQLFVDVMGSWQEIGSSTVELAADQIVLGGQVYRDISYSLTDSEVRVSTEQQGVILLWRKSDTMWLDELEGGLYGYKKLP